MKLVKRHSKQNLAYVIGLALGDGNLSNPNGRATRLRITCDIKYPKLQQRIIDALQKLLPENKVNTMRKKDENAIDVYCYSNKLEPWLGWKAKKGSKYMQRVHVPQWIKDNRRFTIACLRGLFETDGCVYNDRGYLMTTYVTTIPELANDVMDMIQQLGFLPHEYIINLQLPRKPRHNIRVSKRTQEFVDMIQLKKN